MLQQVEKGAKLQKVQELNKFLITHGVPVNPKMGGRERTHRAVFLSVECSRNRFEDTSKSASCDCDFKSGGDSKSTKTALESRARVACVK